MHLIKGQIVTTETLNSAQIHDTHIIRQLPSGCVRRTLACREWLKAVSCILPFCESSVQASCLDKAALPCGQEVLTCGFYNGTKIAGAASVVRDLQVDVFPLVGIGQSPCSNPVWWNSNQGFFNGEWLVLLGWSSGCKRPELPWILPKTLTKQQQPICMIFVYTIQNFWTRCSSNLMKRKAKKVWCTSGRHSDAAKMVWCNLIGCQCFSCKLNAGECWLKWACTISFYCNCCLV